MSPSREVVSHELILGRIVIVRDTKVLLDHDLAALYGVPTKALVRSVKRNINRFPGDFMFQLSVTEFNDLRSQIVTSSMWGGRNRPPPDHGTASSFVEICGAKRAFATASGCSSHFSILDS